MDDSGEGDESADDSEIVDTSEEEGENVPETGQKFSVLPIGTVSSFMSAFINIIILL